MKNDYVWDEKPCVRKDHIDSDEQHPCYYCGKPFPISSVKYCDQCHFAICPSCGKCSCNTSLEEQQALQTLRNTFCCIPVCFRVGLTMPATHNSYSIELHLVPHFVDALNYCRGKVGFKE